ncbi:serine/threonine-protein kinase PknK [Pendulispora albinea]|uniref:non-specific serine/threonine protein kinase n=1 Tax=Pendulispora albinea TaxID=2741071 RepID=A0ABZ2MBV0_9BACT
MLEGHLGEGGMGVVHRARDLERGEVVALKLMTRVDSVALLRFKREFRALADIVHANLVQLYELFSEGDSWFFTMELIDGLDFVAAMHAPGLPATSMERTLPNRSVDDGGSTLEAPIQFYEAAAAGEDRAEVLRAAGGHQPFAVRDVERLRDALRQLADGLSAIHAAGKLHRDVKPSNVLVTRAGRVVLLDFGVVADSTPDRRASDDALVGTPAYMAPEQAAFKRATTASDWYAVGVMLYEVLTRTLPFGGNMTEILMRKQRIMPPPPSELVSGVPQDLERLCMDLLRTDPRERPTGDEVLRRLEGDASLPGISASVEIPFVGRTAQLAALDDAFHASLGGKAVILRVFGRSGMGKSALVSRFLNSLGVRSDVLVLSGRCYEREAVPFKAVDQVVDELSRWLLRAPDEEVWQLVPQGMHQLVRLFPVLRDARMVDSSPRFDAADAEGGSGGGDVEITDPQEIRRRAFGALKELLAAISLRYALVIHIDDMQWGDVDSVQLLESLLAPKALSSVLLVCSYRSELEATSPALQALHDVEERIAPLCLSRRVEVDELSPSETSLLARALLKDSGDTITRAVVAEAHGSPFFVAELARWANERPNLARSEGMISLEQVILARVAELPDDARALLEVLSVAAGPLEHRIAENATGSMASYFSAVLQLRGARLIHTRGLGSRDSAETTHDRIRETLASSLSEERRRQCHLGLARVLASSLGADPEAVFRHFHAAGDKESAKKYAVQAAEAANEALAFMRAARLYEAAIELGAGPARALYRELGDALASAGRGAKAADAYLAAAEDAPADEALELRRIAAEYLMKSGREREGLRVLRTVLEAVDLSYPASTEAALASFVYNDARLRLSWAMRRPTAGKTGSQVELSRVDAAFSAAAGLALTDVLRGADFGTRALLLAIEAGDPLRLCRALAIAAGNIASAGEPSRQRAEEMVRAAEQIAERTGDPHSVALSQLAAAFVHFFLGEWRSARKKLERAEGIFRARCRFASWELANTQAWMCDVLILSGELREAAERIPAIVEDARAREDRFALVQTIYPHCIAYIVGDDVEAAWRATEVLPIGQEPHDIFTSAHWGAMISACSVLRYRGDGVAAWWRSERDMPSLEKTHMLRAAMIRCFTLYERALTAVSAVSNERLALHRSRFIDERELLGVVDRAAKRLAREKLRYAPAMGHMLRACAAAVRGDREGAYSALEMTVPMLDGADLGYLAACARHRLGEVVGGTRGSELKERSLDFFTAQGFRNVERCLAMSAPGFEEILAGS